MQAVKLFIILLSSFILVSVNSFTALPLFTARNKHIEKSHNLLQLPCLVTMRKCMIKLSASRCDAYAAKIKVSSNFQLFRIFSKVLKFFNNFIVGVIFSVILRILNRFKSHHSQILFKYIKNRPNNIGLLTVSNHQSIMDDPGLWAALLPWWRISSDELRWTVCAEENPILQKILALGNVIPLDRSGALDQPLFERFFEKLNMGSWCHVFPEGRVFQDWRFEKDQRKLGPLKIGVGKLIAHCQNSPLIIPIYHKGMDEIVPEKIPVVKAKARRAASPKSIIPNIGKKVELFVGHPFNLSTIIQEFEVKHPGVLREWRTTPEKIELYTQLTNAVEKELLILENKAWGTPPPPS